ncbi:hypothetical protein RHMOL_Rhmol02G0202200 [Rhododendron molle]|uniref:Uncharacterized protein n=1 Tax=Rhododendron molle TaxID=49168 RepID=A0ACC0PTK0_RHOML|nr:hypothetical protein RHMOL_Rhmol02G0202200 [Rhododendron molle]
MKSSSSYSEWSLGRCKWLVPFSFYIPPSSFAFFVSEKCRCSLINVRMLLHGALAPTEPDNSEADEQQNHPQDQAHLASPATGMPHPGITTPSIQYATPSLIGPGNAMTNVPIHELLT